MKSRHECDRTPEVARPQSAEERGSSAVKKAANETIFHSTTDGALEIRTGVDHEAKSISTSAVHVHSHLQTRISSYNTPLLFRFRAF
jgi:hypothetical protein